VIDGSIAIELKLSLSRSSDADRAIGQIGDYIDAWPDGPFLLVVCNTRPSETNDWLATRVTELRTRKPSVLAVRAGTTAG
jgi:hypothetical protein